MYIVSRSINLDVDFRCSFSTCRWPDGAYVFAVVLSRERSQIREVLLNFVFLPLYVLSPISLFFYVILDELIFNNGCSNMKSIRQRRSFPSVRARTLFRSESNYNTHTSVLFVYRTSSITLTMAKTESVAGLISDAADEILIRPQSTRAPAFL